MSPSCQAITKISFTQMKVSGCRTTVDHGHRFCHDHVGLYKDAPLFRLLYRTLSPENVLHVIDTRKHATQQSIIQVQDHEIAHYTIAKRSLLPLSTRPIQDTARFSALCDICMPLVTYLHAMLLTHPHNLDYGWIIKKALYPLPRDDINAFLTQLRTRCGVNLWHALLSCPQKLLATGRDGVQHTGTDVLRDGVPV